MLAYGRWGGQQRGIKGKCQQGKDSAMAGQRGQGEMPAG